MRRATFLFLLLLPLLPIRAHAIQSGSLTWVLVDTMENAYSMLSNRVSPLDYGPETGSVALVHRAKTSYGSGSGELWYNSSPDGLAWSRVGPLCSGSPILSRFPSSVLIEGGFLATAATQVDPLPQETILYGVEGVCLEVYGSFQSHPRIAAARGDSGFWIAVPTGQDVGTVLVIRSGQMINVWPDSIFHDWEQEVGLTSVNGSAYLGGLASFPGDAHEVFNIFYSASGDQGNTWSAPNGPYIGVGDWRDLSAIASSSYDNWEVRLAFDMVVDHLGYVHFLGILEDTDDPEANLAVVEIYEDESGWNSNFVAENLVASTRTGYGGFDRMGYHVSAAMSEDGMAMAAFWLSAASPGNILPDIWTSTRHVTGETWSEPVNLTNTPDYAELLLQVAPVLRSDGGDGYTAFIARAYEQGSTSYPPSDLAATDIFCATVPLVISATDVAPEDPIPLASKLSQNYPNPFNGQTRISYTVGSPRLIGGQAQSVVLKVYDILGREMATLVNEAKDAGTHSVSWDAAGLPSGVYYYRLEAGSFVETRKLVLIR